MASGRARDVERLERSAERAASSPPRPSSLSRRESSRSHRSIGRSLDSINAHAHHELQSRFTITYAPTFRPSSSNLGRRHRHPPPYCCTTGKTLSSPPCDIAHPRRSLQATSPSRPLTGRLTKATSDSYQHARPFCSRLELRSTCRRTTQAHHSDEGSRTPRTPAI